MGLLVCFQRSGYKVIKDGVFDKDFTNKTEIFVLNYQIL